MDRCCHRKREESGKKARGRKRKRKKGKEKVIKKLDGRATFAVAELS